MKVFYWNGILNAGDIFSKWILEKMGFNVEFSTSPEIGVCGSILSSSLFRESKIWGLGFGNYFERNDLIRASNIFALRGKLSSKILNYTGITGDPGILASKFYKSDTEKKYRYGIIPHYVDYNFVNSLNLKTMKVIKIETDNLEKLFDDINECEFILSSSLHGIIFSHSFGIPAFHIKMKELSSKNGFKFLDYYSNFEIEYEFRQINDKSEISEEKFEVLYRNKELFLPTKSEIEKAQYNLLMKFPF